MPTGTYQYLLLYVYEITLATFKPQRAENKDRNFMYTEYRVVSLVCCLICMLCAQPNFQLGTNSLLSTQLDVLECGMALGILCKQNSF